MIIIQRSMNILKFKKWLFILLCVCSQITYGHDIEVDGIYYNIISDNSVSVTYYGDYQYSAQYSGEIVIPESISYNGNSYIVTEIGNCSFAFCDLVPKVILPNSIKTIQSSAFWQNGGITYINFPEGLERIENSAFFGAVRVNFDSFPSTLKYIGNSAFYGAALNLTTINIPKNVEEVGTSAFGLCWELRNITIQNPKTRFHNGCFYDSGWRNDHPDGYLVIDNVLFGYKGTIPSSISIPEGVIQIVQNCFCDEQNITEIIMPNSVKYIYDNAFAKTSVESITLSSNLCKLGQTSFSRCQKLKNLNFNNCPLDSIERLTFSQCSSLESIAFSDYTKLISTGAFYDCIELKEIHLPSSLTSIGRGSFQQCALESITFGGNEEYIYEAAFSDNNLTKIKFPEHLKLLDCVSFSGNKNLSYVEIPSSLQEIGYWSFFIGDKLDSLIVNWEDPNICSFKYWANTTSTNLDIVYNYYYNTITLYVPKGTSSVYKESPLWGQFSNIVEIDDSNGIDDKQYTNKESSKCFDLQGRMIKIKPKTIYIMNGKKYAPK